MTDRLNDEGGLSWTLATQRANSCVITVSIEADMSENETACPDQFPHDIAKQYINSTVQNCKFTEGYCLFLKHEWIRNFELSSLLYRYRYYPTFSTMINTLRLATMQANEPCLPGGHRNLKTRRPRSTNIYQLKVPCP